MPVNVRLSYPVHCDSGEVFPAGTAVTLDDYHTIEGAVYDIEMMEGTQYVTLPNGEVRGLEPDATDLITRLF